MARAWDLYAPRRHARVVTALRRRRDLLLSLAVFRSTCMAQLTTNPRGPLTLTGSLLTQAEPSEALPLTAVTGQPGGGLVVSGRDALQLGEHLKGRGDPAPLLAD